MVRAVWVSMYCLILDNIYTLWPAFFILFLMWSLNCSLLSKTMPKYEKLFTNFNWIPLTSSIGSLQSSCAFLLKNMHFVLSRLTDSLFALNQPVSLVMSWPNVWLVGWFAPTLHLLRCWHTFLTVLNGTERHNGRDIGLKWAVFISQNTDLSVICETKHVRDGRSLFSGQITLFNLKFISQNTDLYFMILFNIKFISQNTDVHAKWRLLISFRFAKYSKPGYIGYYCNRPNISPPPPRGHLGLGPYFLLWNGYR